MNEKYWFHDIKILTTNYQNILPRDDMTYSEKVNSLIRLSIIIGLILSIVYNNHLFIYIPVITMLLTYILYLFRESELHSKIKNKNSFHNILNKPYDNNNSYDESYYHNYEKYNNIDKHKNIDSELIDKFEGYLKNISYTQPDIENPFMNPLPFDNRKRPPAVNTLNDNIKQAEIEIMFDHGNYRDVNDIFDKNNSKRQFFTIPYTTFPNNQSSFVNWLYKMPLTCKEGNGAQCVANNYTPLNNDLGRLTAGYKH
jgi:hypothetical protein